MSTTNNDDPYYAVAPTKLHPKASRFVKPGKAYRISKFGFGSPEPSALPHGRGFYLDIKTAEYPDGFEAYCLERDCAHLVGGDWKIGKPPYGPMCMSPERCVGKGSCPRNPTCGD